VRGRTPRFLDNGQNLWLSRWFDQVLDAGVGAAQILEGSPVAM